MILALIHHPHALKKVQAEIDEVVGNDRLPQFTDRHRLPYVDCIIKEVLRWGTTVPLSVPYLQFRRRLRLLKLLLYSASTCAYGTR